MSNCHREHSVSLSRKLRRGTKTITLLVNPLSITSGFMSRFTCEDHGGYSHDSQSRRVREGWILAF